MLSPWRFLARPGQRGWAGELHRAAGSPRIQAVPGSVDCELQGVETEPRLRWVPGLSL